MLARDRHDLSGHVGRVVTRQEDHHVRDFPGFGPTPEGFPGLEHVEQIGRGRSPDRRMEGGHLVDGPAERELQPEAIASRQRDPVDDLARGAREVSADSTQEVQREIRRHDRRFRRPFK